MRSIPMTDVRDKRGGFFFCYHHAMRPFPEKDRKEFSLFKGLKSPAKVQDFLDSLPINFEEDGETCRSPLVTLRSGKAHCAEGAMLAAAIFWHHGRPPILLDLKATRSKGDVDHVVTLFKEDGRWGAISKTNHPVLRYRDPIYKTVRELALSYFNEYFMPSGWKTLRSHSGPFNMLGYGDAWLTQEGDLLDVMSDLDDSRHFDIMTPSMARRLRLADPLERQAIRLAEWPKSE